MLTKERFEAILAAPERNRRTVKRKPTPYTWLKELISGIDFGRRKPDPKNPGGYCSPHENPKKVVLRAFNSRQFWRLRRMRNRDYDAHFAGAETFFFAGGKGRRTLVLIDVDCKRCGTPEGAKAYCEFLAQTSLFKGLYHEPSTNGRGRHGYLIYDHGCTSADDVNYDLLKVLQPHLNRLAVGFDIEFVEVKGTLPVLRWSDRESGVLLSVTTGQLGKLPRDVSRFKDWQATAVLTGNDFCVGGPMDQEDSSSPPPQGSVERKPAQSSSSDPSQPRLKVNGSISGRHFGEAELAGLDSGGIYRETAERLLARHSIRTSGRQVATADDVAIVLMIGEWLTNNMFADGSMPVARWKGFWEKIYAAGDIGRAWDSKRFAAIRGYLDSLGLLVVEDETYRPPARDALGNLISRGQAAKWRFSPELMQKLADGRAEASSSATADLSLTEGEASLKGTTFPAILTAWAESLSRKPDNEVFRPTCVLTIPLERFDPDEVTRLTGYYSLLCA